jgi:hypothetical protein
MSGVKDADDQRKTSRRGKQILLNLSDYLLLIFFPEFAAFSANPIRRNFTLHKYAIG